MAVQGFRSPRFDVPAGIGLARYRDVLAEAGYRYVSDTACSGASSPVRELPVLRWRGLRIGGGSYQRLLPFSAARPPSAAAGPAVLYYHSYDFDGTLPGTGAVRSRSWPGSCSGGPGCADVFSRRSSASEARPVAMRR